MNRAPITLRSTPLPSTALFGLLTLFLTAGCTLEVNTRTSETREPWHLLWAVQANSAEMSAGGWFPGSTGELLHGPKSRLSGVYCLHPVDERQPAVLRYQGRMEAGQRRIVIRAAGHEAGDTEISVFGVGTSFKMSWVVAGKEGTRVLEVELPAEVSPESLRVSVSAGGIQPWYFEGAYIDDIHFSK